MDVIGAVARLLGQIVELFEYAALPAIILLIVGGGIGFSIGWISQRRA